VNKNMFKTDVYVLVQQTVSVMYSYLGGWGANVHVLMEEFHALLLR